MLVALPIEAVNFWVIGYPAGSSGLSSATQSAAIALQWYLFHLPGIIASDRIVFLRGHALTCNLMFLIVGYIDTTFLLTAILWAARLALRTLHRLSSPMKHAH